MRWFKKFLKICSWSAFGLAVVGFIAVGIVIYVLEDDLPDVTTLNNVQLQVPLRIYSRDGELMAEYGQKKRIPAPYKDIPPLLVYAVLATEDQRFFEHPGVDIFGLARASIQVVITGNKVQGGSTITMQVARNFFLTRKKTYSRKLKEILLAIKIDSVLTKERILSLYLNKIYLGNRAYGVGAAAHVYYGKNLSELTLAQMAMIAGLPKAPSALNPLRNSTAALKRRNHVLSRMLEQEYITEKDYELAISAPVTASYHYPPITVKAPYLSEMVRKMLYEQFGEAAYTSGLNVYTTAHSRLLKAADKTVKTSLLTYDKRHGFRGAIANLGSPRLGDLDAWLIKLKEYPSAYTLLPAAVVTMKEHSISVINEDGNIIALPWTGLKWARPSIKNGKYVGKIPQTAADIVKLGDVVYIEPTNGGQYQLSQLPDVEAALVSVNPQTGAVEALVGGFDFYTSNFNRVTQARRQPGSSFKPFIYSAALSKGFTLASIINDAPVVFDNPSDNARWRPQNVNKRFFGPTRIRVGLTKSRNLVSIRLMDAVGISYTLDYLKKFGFDTHDMPRNLSLALGSGAVTPLDMVEAYSVLANGGYNVKPYLVSYITNSKSEVIFQSDAKIACEPCIVHEASNFFASSNVDQKRYAPAVITPQVAYLMNSVLKDVIKQGTGRGVRQTGLERNDLSGKTGTTNDQKDAWFAGFNSDFATVVWVGFDQPHSLYEYASKVALPIWAEFMKIALDDVPEHSLPEPPGVVSVRIDNKTGRLAESWQPNTLFEYFTTDTVPTRSKVAADDSEQDEEDAETIHTTQIQSDYFGEEESSDERLF